MQRRNKDEIFEAELKDRRTDGTKLPAMYDGRGWGESRGRVRSPTSLRHNKIARRKKRPRGRDCPERSPNQAPTSSLFLFYPFFYFFPSRNLGHLLSLAASRSRSRGTRRKFDLSDDIMVDSNSHVWRVQIFLNVYGIFSASIIRFELDRY